LNWASATSGVQANDLASAYCGDHHLEKESGCASGVTFYHDLDLYRDRRHSHEDDLCCDCGHDLEICFDCDCVCGRDLDAIEPVNESVNWACVLMQDVYDGRTAAIKAR